MTTLTVVEDPGVPGRFNVSGSGLDFTVNITNERIDITGAEHSVDVTVVGGRANIRWFIETLVSRNNMGMACLPDPDDPMVYSLADISGDIDGTQLYNSTGQPIILCQSTTALYWRVGTTLYKTGLGGHTELDDTFSSVTATLFESISEGKLYGLALDGSDMVMNLYDFDANTTTELYSDTAESNESWYSLNVIGAPGAEQLVALSLYTEYLGSPIFAYKYHAIIRVFNTIDNSLVRKSTIDFTQASYGTNRFSSNGFENLQPPGCVVPQILDNKVIYSFYEQWSHYPNIPYTAPDYYHFTGMLVYDASDGTNSITRVMNNVNNFRNIGAVEIGIDYETEYYYWLEVQTEPTYTPAIKEYRLYKSPVSSPSITLVETLDHEDYLRFVIGKTNLYGIRYSTGNIVKMSSAGTVGSVPAEMDPLDLANGRDSAWQLDETDKRVWFTDNSVLYGASIDGDPDKEITLNDGSLVTGSIVSFNQVKNGVAFTSATKLGLSEG